MNMPIITAGGVTTAKTDKNKTTAAKQNGIVVSTAAAIQAAQKNSGTTQQAKSSTAQTTRQTAQQTTQQATQQTTAKAASTAPVIMPGGVVGGAHATQEAKKGDAGKTVTLADMVEGNAWSKPATSVSELRKRAAQTENPLARLVGESAVAGAYGIDAGLVGAAGTLAGIGKELVSGSGKPENVAQANRTFGRAADFLNGAYEGLSEKRAEHTAEAQRGQDAVGRIASEAVTSGTQMLGDAAANLLVPGSSLAVMGVRAAGDASQRARQSGADAITSAMYGAAVGGVEAVSEKLFDGLAGIYGKGAADEVVNRVIENMAKTEGGRTALHVLSSMGGEALEEVFSGAVDPALESIYNGKRIGANYSVDTLADIAHDALIGGILGGIGGAVDAGGKRYGNATGAPVAAQARQTSVESNITPKPNNGAEARISPDMAQTKTAAPKVETAAVERTPAQGASLAETQIDPRTQPLGETPTRESSIAKAEALVKNNGIDYLNKHGPEAYERDFMDAYNRGDLKETATGDVAVVREEDHIDNRTDRSVSPRSVKSFQYLNPEVHPYYASVAQILLDELNEAKKGGQIDPYYELVSAEGGIYNTRYKRSKRNASKAVSELLDNNRGRSYEEIRKALEDIVADKAHENYALAKRVEIAIDNLIESDYFVEHEQVPLSQLIDIEAYRKAKDAIRGAAARDETHVDELADIDALPDMETQDEAQGQAEPQPAAQAQENAPAPQSGKTVEIDTLHARDGSERYFPVYVNGNIRTPVIPGKTFQTSTAAMEAAEGYGDFGNATGAAEVGFSVSHGEQVPTQNKTTTTDTTLTEDERAELAPKPHERISEAQSVERAQQQFYADENGEVTHLDDTVQTLLEKELWTGADQDAAQLAKRKLTEQMHAEKEANGAASDETRQKLAELVRAIDQRGTEAGRSLQARQKWVNTSADIITRADRILENARKNTDAQAVLDTITDLALDFDDAVEAKNWTDVADIIRRTSRIRRTGSFFTNQWSKTMQNALDSVIEHAKAGDESAQEFLENHAANGLVAIAQDYAPVAPSNAVITIRRNAMLSKLNTTLRNLVSNNVFDPIDSVSRNLSVPLDMLLSKSTGTRSVAPDASWFSSAKRKGAIEGLERSILEVGLDVDATGERGRYENGAQRTFSMNGGTVSRLLSTWEKHLGYRLYSTDQFQKGGIDAEIQRGLDELYERGLITDDTLRNGGATEALYRTFQDETQLSKLSIAARRALNSIQFNGHYMHLGDIAIPFAQVPANLGTRALEYSPVGLANGIFQLGQVLQAAHNGTLTAAQQAKAVQSIGRGMNGTALIASAVALALKGVLKVSDVGGDEDKDKKALEKQSGINGTQINLSALERWKNGESTEWRDGDVLHSIGYLDPLNAQLTTGALIAQDYAGDDASPSTILKDTLEGTIQSVLDIPVMSTLKDTAESYHYSTADTEGGKLIDAGQQFLAGQAASIVPNNIKGLAQGTDRYQRDQYSEKSVAAQTWDAIRASIPGMREELPEKLNSYGEPLENADMALNFINANVSPGAYTRYQRPQQEVTQELDRLNDATHDNGVYPSRSAPNSVSSDGEKIELTTEEKRGFQQTAGREFLNFANAIIGGERYGELTDQQKADALSSAVIYANAKARQDVIAAHGGEYALSGEARTVEKALEANAAGIDPSEYFLLKVAHDEIDGGDGSANDKATQFMNYLRNTPWLTDEQRQTAAGLLTFSGGFTGKASDAAMGALDNGVSFDVWQAYHDATSAMTADKDENGNSISGSKKAKVVEYISGMDVTPEQKDWFYLNAGYAEKDLPNMPWH